MVNLKSKIRYASHLLKETIIEFRNDNLIHFTGSLSFYILISMPSVVYVLITTIGLVMGHTSVTDKINEQIVAMVGKERAAGIELIIQKTSSFNPDPVIKTISILFLLFTSTGAFVAIQDTLKVVWKINSSNELNFFKTIGDRILSFTMILVVAVVFIALMIVEAFLAAFSNYIDKGGISMIVFLNMLFSFVIYTFLFALICKIMSPVRISWKGLWPASIVASILFMLGKFILIKYLAVMDYNYTYAAGAMIVILSWIFYSSFVFCISAELVQVFVKNPFIKQSRKYNSNL